MVLINRDSTLALSCNVQIIKNGQANQYKNRVLQDGLLYLAEFILGNPDSPISHIAVGDDDTPNNIMTASLGNERFRKEFTTSYLNNTFPVFETFFTEQEANFNWKEAGLFAGGTAELGTGRLIARVVVDEVKNDNVTISTNWEFRITNT